MSKTVKKRTIRTIPQQRAPMREQDPKERARNFEEVSCGFRVEDALHESERCLFCPDPACVEIQPRSWKFVLSMTRVSASHRPRASPSHVRI